MLPQYQELLPPPGEVHVFTDGACSGNPGPGGWAALVIYPQRGDFYFYELGDHEAQTTNNRMEIKALLRAITDLAQKSDSILREIRKVTLFSDSAYALNGIEKWLPNWKQRQWKTLEGDDVKNKELWLEFDSVTVAWRKNPELPELVLKKIKGHAGNIGNERVDSMAVEWSQWREGDPAPAMRHGVVPKDWRKAAPDFAAIAAGAENKFPEIFRAKFPYYLAWAQGALKVFATWKECEAQVKGRPQVKFQKISSREQLIEALEKWGVS